MTTATSIDEVRNFWEKNPLWTGETQYLPGTKEFFEEHRKVVINDCLAGRFDDRYLPDKDHRKRVLDLGCGPGFWTVELARQECEKVVSADLTHAALDLTKRRCEVYGLSAELSLQNAEAMTFASGSFSHVNCQGVIHHTPDTESCIREIARVLEQNGTASISVYYRNVFLRSWPILRWLIKPFAALTPKLSGRGREGIASVSNVDEIVRLYDGLANPIGKAYTKVAFFEMLEPYFEITGYFLNFFPARAFPFPITQTLHRWLEANLGFMLVVSLKKKSSR